MRLEDLQIYQLSIQLGDSVWDIVAQWNYFERNTIGKQMVRAADSVSANISEGFGRFFYKDEKLLCYYSRGSLFETKTWLTKAYNRNLIEKLKYERLIKELNILAVKLNNYIKSIGKNPKV